MSFMNANVLHDDLISSWRAIKCKALNLVVMWLPLKYSPKVREQRQREPLRL